MGHVLDYDDTHMGGVMLHTSSPVLAAAPRAGRARARERPRSHACLCRRVRGRGAQRTHGAAATTKAAGISPARSAASLPARLPASCSSSTAEAYLRPRHRDDPGRRHAAKPRHHVQVVPCRQSRLERRAGSDARRARLRQHAGDHRGQRRLLPHLQRRGPLPTSSPPVWCGRG